MVPKFRFVVSPHKTPCFARSVYRPLLLISAQKTFLFEILTDFIVPLFYEQDIAVFDGTFTVFKFFTKLKDTDILPSVRSTEALRTWRLFSLRLLKGNI